MTAPDPPTSVTSVDFDPAAGVRFPPRLDALAAASLCDTPPEPAFDNVVELIADLLGVPIALVSLVDDRRQFFKAQRGLPEPVASARETPLSHSFCQYLVAADTALVIDDAREDPVLATNGAVADLGVIAYAGYPIRGPGGHAIGSLCAIDTVPRTWSEDDLSLLARLADVIADLVSFRSGALAAEDRQATIAQLVESQEVERTRVAAELHDDTLQVLSALSIRLQLIARTAEPAVAEELGDLTDDVTDAGRRIRRYVTDLRPDALGDEDLATVVAEQLSWAVERHAGVDTTFTSSVTDEPDDAIKVTLFRIAQQAIANSLAHSQPSRVTVAVETDDASTMLTVTDDGVGFDPAGDAPAGHHGIRIMRERANLTGGTLTVTSSPGQGTTIVASLPAHPSS